MNTTITYSIDCIITTTNTQW